MNKAKLAIITVAVVTIMVAYKVWWDSRNKASEEEKEDTGPQWN